ncbi:hypothetical protein E4L95_14690 [Paracoccus liaowanqingii]|uniref:Transposase n=1 Tax=Paracoccus liaowanqingii TaxID=2560053 RepID=A0A4Z1BY33_9RHOB|nr:hypothetical protein E4L95_14690 [Paracoccus liaowanqingii]
MTVMTKSKMANRYSPEVRARAVRMVFEHQGSYETQAGAITSSTSRRKLDPHDRPTTNCTNYRHMAAM